MLAKTLLFVCLHVFILGASAQMINQQDHFSRSTNAIKGDYYVDYDAFELAILHYRLSVKERKNDGYSMMQLGGIYYRLGKADSAYYWYQQARKTEVQMTERHARQEIYSMIIAGRPKEVLPQLAAYESLVYQNNTPHRDTTFIVLDKLPIHIQDDQWAVQVWKDKLLYRTKATSNELQWYLYSPNEETVRFVLNELPIDEVRALAFAEESNQIFYIDDGQKVYSGRMAEENEVTDISRVKLKNFDADPQTLAINPQGNVMYLSATSEDNKSGANLYQTNWNGKKWSTPGLMNALNSDHDEVMPALGDQSTLYFGSNNNNDFQVFEVNQKTGKARLLPEPFNSANDEMGIFWINPQEGYLVTGNTNNQSMEIHAVTVIDMKVPLEEKPERMISSITKGGLPIYTSSYENVRLISKNENIDFMLIPGADYQMIVHLENQRYGLEERKVRRSKLPRNDLFTFNIKAIALDGQHQSGWLDPNEKRIEDIRLYPGDLVTFQLIPQVSTRKAPTRILYKGEELAMNSLDTIDFGYVIEEPKKPKTKEELEEEQREEELLMEELLAEATARKKAEVTSEPEITAESLAAESAETESEVASEELTEDSEAWMAAEDSQQPADSTTITSSLIASESDEIEEPELSDEEAAKMANDRIAALLGQVSPSDRPQNQPEETSDGSKPTLDTLWTTSESALAVNEMDTAQNDESILSENQSLVSNEDEQITETDDTNWIATESVAEQEELIDNMQEPILDDEQSVATEMQASNLQQSAVIDNASEMMDSTQTIASITDRFEASEEQQTIANDESQTEEAIATNEKVISDEETAENTSNKDALIANNQQVISNNSSNSLTAQTKEAQLTENKDVTSRNLNNYNNTSSIAAKGEESTFEKVTTVKKNCYRVQIAAALKPIAQVELQRIYSGPLPIKMFQIDGYYKYYIADADSYKVANDIRLSSGVKGAFITKCILVETNELLADASRSSTQEAPEELVTETPANTMTASEGSTKLEEQSDPAAGIEEPSNLQEHSEQTIPPQVSWTANDSNTNEPVEEESNQELIDEEPIEISTELLPELTTENQQLVTSEKSTEEQAKQEEVVQQVETNPTPQENIALTNEALADTTKSIEFDRQKDISEDPEVIVASQAPEYKEKIEKTVPEPIDTTPIVAVAEQSEEKRLDFIEDLEDHPDKESKLLYRVQIAAAKRPLSEGELNRIYAGPLTPKYFQEDDYYKYYISELPSYFLARQIQKESNLKQSFIVAYQDEEKLTKYKALERQYAERMQSESLQLEDEVIKVYTVYFELDEFILEPDQAKRLQAVLEVLDAQGQYYVIVDGHTDSQGNDAYNFGLSEERALHVKKLLTQKGVSSKRIITNYYGESHLAEQCDHPGACNDEVHQANRRVEILIVSPEE